MVSTAVFISHCDGNTIPSKQDTNTDAMCACVIFKTGRDRMQIKCDKWMQFLLQPLTLSYGCEKFTSSFKSTLVCSEILSPKQYNDG